MKTVFIRNKAHFSVAQMSTNVSCLPPKSVYFRTCHKQFSRTSDFRAKPSVSEQRTDLFRKIIFSREVCRIHVKVTRPKRNSSYQSAFSPPWFPNNRKSSLMSNFRDFWADKLLTGLECFYPSGLTGENTKMLFCFEVVNGISS